MTPVSCTPAFTRLLILWFPLHAHPIPTTCLVTSPAPVSHNVAPLQVCTALRGGDLTQGGPQHLGSGRQWFAFQGKTREFMQPWEVCLQWDCNLAVLPSFSATRFGNRKVLNSVNNLWFQPAISPARIWSSSPSHFPVSWNPFYPLAWTICAHPTFSLLLHGPALQSALNLSALPGFPMFSSC